MAEVIWLKLYGNVHMEAERFLLILFVGETRNIYIETMFFRWNHLVGIIQWGMGIRQFQPLGFWIWTLGYFGLQKYA